MTSCLQTLLQHCDHQTPSEEEATETTDDAPKMSFTQKLLRALLGSDEQKDEGPVDTGPRA